MLRRSRRAGLDLAGDLLLGSCCPGCAHPGLGICGRCVDALAARRPRATAPDPAPAGFPSCVTTGPYDVLLRSLIGAVKEEQALLVTPAMGHLLAASLRELVATGTPTGPVLVVPVPSAPSAVRRRGYDATDAMARRAVRILRAEGLDVTRRRLLRGRRRVADQAGLGVAARAANLAGAYAAVPGSGTVVLVDDVVTTGASLAEGARALRAAGWTVRGAAVVAATVRRVPARAGRGWPDGPGGAVDPRW